MATTTSITSTYAGEFAGKYISAALLSGSTIANGGIEVMPNVKYKQVIQRIATDGIVKDATCDFDATSTVTLTERILQPEEFQVNLQLCKKDFHQTWEAITMGYSAFDTLPPSFADYLISHVAAKVAEKTEQNIWKGVTANAGEFAGLVTLATADSSVIDVASPASGGITAANVIAELGKVVDAIPAALYGKEDLYLYLSQSAARAYVRALGGFGASGLGANGTNNMGTQWWNNGSLSFDGVKIFVANGMADDYVMAAQKSNLFFGTGLLSDQNEVQLIDMSPLDGSQNVRVVMRFTATVNYGIGSEIVLYTPAA
jgi:DNA-binding beta-propeller fold protein YncE